MKALITGGGTGGHIYPALSIALKLEEEGWKVLYTGSNQGMESEIVPGNGLDFVAVEVAPLPRRITPEILKSLFKNMKGFFQARRIIKNFAPDVILGTGGFVSGVVVLAGSRMGVPTIIHEQNAYPGVTNRLLSMTVDKIALNFAGAREHFPGKAERKFVLTGNPVREKILHTSRQQGIRNLKLNPGRKTLLVFGGSQGSSSINQAMETVCREFYGKSWLQIVYITGRDNYQQVIEKLKIDNNRIQLDDSSNIKIMPYLDKMEWAYAAADLVIYRAGATGLAEITARGIPAILIPYPYATGNHQEFNARNMKENGAAEVILDEELNGELLVSLIKKLFADQLKLNSMKRNSRKLGRPEARDKLVKEIRKIADTKTGS